MEHYTKKNKKTAVIEIPTRRHDYVEADDDFEEALEIRNVKGKDVAFAPKVGTSNITRKRKLTFRDLTMTLPKLRCRTSPSTIQRTIDELSDNQKRDVKEIGFGHILSYNVTQVPTPLAFWVLQNFDPKTRSIALQQGRSIRIEPDDVYRVLGFPKGTRKIKREGASCSKHLLQCWETLFPNKDSVVPNNVADKLKEFKNGGEWFKRLFMVLVIGCLVGSTANGYISPNVMSCLDDLTQLRELDWGEYVISSLVDKRILWDGCQTKYFFGPAFFLTAFYVDRVELYKNKVPRLFPTCINWDYYNLKERLVDEIKSGGFGGGFPIPPIEADYDKDNVVAVKVSEVEEKNVGEPKINVAREKSVEPNSKNYAGILLTKSKNVAASMIELVQLLERMPEQVTGNMMVGKLVASAQTLLGCNIKEASSLNLQPTKPIVVLEDDEDPEFIAQVLATCEQMENAAVRMEEYSKGGGDMPSFSLGIPEISDEISNNGEVADGVHSPEEKRHQVSVNFDRIIDAGRDIENEQRNSLTHKDGLRLVVGNEKIQDGAHITHGMVRRSKDGIKKTVVLLSPNIIRASDASVKLRQFEMKMVFYALHNNKDDSRLSEILFDDGTVQLNRETLLSMRQGTLINSAIVDVWSIVLNFKEGLRSKASPSRFFATTDVTLESIVNPPKMWPRKRCYETFAVKLQVGLNQSARDELQNIDLFFFPIYKEEHFFVICIDIKKNVLHLIDNANYAERESGAAKYGRVPNVLRDMFVEFMRQRDLCMRVRRLDIAVTRVMKLPWVEHKNKIDSAIYAMRHMETFMGETDDRWKHGLNHRMKTQMKSMRVRCCAALILAKNNTIRDGLIDAANVHYRQACESGPLNLSRVLMHGA